MKEIDLDSHPEAEEVPCETGTLPPPWVRIKNQGQQSKEASCCAINLRPL